MMARKILYYITVFFSFIILIVVGFQLGFEGIKKISNYQKVQKEADMIPSEEKEKVNRKLVQGMQWVSVESEIYVDSSEFTGAARLTNGSDSNMLVSFSLQAESDGTMLYKSGILEPGQYIERISLQQKIKEGSYGCIGIWSFYDRETEEYIGEMAESLVVIVMDNG